MALTPEHKRKIQEEAIPLLIAEATEQARQTRDTAITDRKAKEAAHQQTQSDYLTAAQDADSKRQLFEEADRNARELELAADRAEAERDRNAAAKRAAATASRATANTALAAYNTAEQARLDARDAITAAKTEVQVARTTYSDAETRLSQLADPGFAGNEVTLANVDMLNDEAALDAYVINARLTQLQSDRAATQQALTDIDAEIASLTP